MPVRKEVKIAQTVVSLIKGDITALQVDALVNAANNHLWMGGGVAVAIKRKGGADIEVEAIKQGPIPVGEVVITSGGKLAARYVIHAAVMGQDLKTDRAKIRQATRASLKLCQEKGLNSVAFPALGTGVGGFPYAEAARAIFSELVDYLNNFTGLKSIVFALFDQAAFDSFAAELDNIERQ
jgi:O-acetyl-ADP-ribose deacetylase (regulator of RNase III)